MFRLGPAHGYATDSGKRVAFPEQQFPLDYFDQFAKQWAPRWAGHEAITSAAYDALIERVGPCIVVGHSQGGGFAMLAAQRQPSCVRAVVALEPSGAPADVLDLPLLNIHAAPDGYTVFFTTQTTQAANPALMKKPRYDPIKDFAPVGRVAYTPALLVSNPALPVKNLDDLIALAKAQPGKLSYASGSAGTLVPAAMLTTAANIEMLHVPYKSIPLGLNDVIAGHVAMMFTEVVTGTQQVKAGKVRALGISSLKPWPSLPDVPPIANRFPGFELLARYGMYVPANTPAPVINRLSTALKTVMDDAAVRDRLVGLGLEVSYSTAPELATFGKSELDKWARVIKAAGIQPE